MRKGFQASTLIARPPDIVWAIITDFGQAPAWMPGIEAVTPKDDSPLAAGKVFQTSLSTLGRGRKRDMTLVQWDPANRVFALSSSEGSVTAVYQYSLESKGKETKVTLQARCESDGLFMKLMSPLILRMMARHDSRQMPMLKVVAEQTAGC